MRLRLWLALVALAVLPATADAHRHHHHHAHRVVVSRRYSPVQAAYGIAARYWGAQPCNGDVTITREAPPAGMNVAQFTVPGMWSSWDAGTTFENNESAPLPFSRCHIGISPEVWPTEQFEAYTAWPEFAVQMTHEVGHLLGHDHSADPASVMYSGVLSAKPWVAGEVAPGWG